jgi:hypothetical protein
MKVIDFSELYGGWINYERHLMTQNQFSEESVYKQRRNANAGYQNDIRDALFVFWDWLSTFIIVQKYNVFESSEILVSLSNLSENHKNAYNEIKNKLEIGETVQPYQRHLNEKFQTKINYIFTHWNIRHLHLNVLRDKQQSVKPTQYILFIRIENNNAYLIDIVRHTKDGHEFHDEQLLTIIDNNWNDLLLNLNFSVSKTPQPIDSTSIKTLHNRNVNIVHIINGRSIMPSSGVNGAGGKQESMQRYDRAVFILKNLEACLKTNYPFTKRSSNKILYVLPCGWNSGIVVFDNNHSNDGFVIICKINKDDTSFIEGNFKIVRKSFPNLLKSTASEIKTKLYVNDSLLVYIPFNNPNKPYFKRNDSIYF